MRAKMIKSYLDESGIKYSHLAKQVKMPINQLSAMLNGKRKMSADEYISICKSLDLPLDYFATDCFTAN